MTITIRLNHELEANLENLAQIEGITKSVLVRRCIENYIKNKRDQKTPWELGKGMFGKYGSGQKNLSIDRKKIIREKIHAKKNSH